MGKIEVEMDGGCLFRSLAVGVFFQEFGINLGSGCILGEESTIKEMVHNILSRWIRTIIMYSMFYPNTTLDTKLYNEVSFLDILIRLFAIIQAYGVKYRFQSSREKRKLKREFLYPIQLSGLSDGKFPILEDMIPVNIISMGGRDTDETHSKYCKRMMHLTSWGGASEIYIASKIFQYTIYIKEGKKIVQKYTPKKIKNIIQVVYDSKKEHYDAFIKKN
jgi:hypothetical protein